MSFGVIVLLLIAAPACVLVTKYPNAALRAMVVLIPWQGLEFDFGVRVLPSVLIGGLLFVLTLQRATLRGVPRGAVLGAVAAYAILWTILVMSFLPSAEVSGRFARQPVASSALQILMFLITISPVWIVPRIVKDNAEIVLIGKLFLLSLCILAFLGWIQMGVWGATGRDPFPVGYVNEILGGTQGVKSGIIWRGDSMIFRMASFGGEPKVFGISMLVGLLVIQGGWLGKRERKRWALWCFLFASLVASFSTMALIGWVGATVLQFAIRPGLDVGFPRSIRCKRGLAPIVLLFLIVFAVGSIGSIGSIGSDGSALIKLIEDRTVTRVSSEGQGVLEDFNVAILGFLENNPSWAITGTGLGNAHLYANAYLPEDAVRYADGTAFVAKSGALRWVSEVGTMTLIMFIYWVYAGPFLRLKRTCNVAGSRRICSVIGRLLFPLFFLWVVAAYCTGYLFVALGLAIAASRIDGRSGREF